MKQPSERAELHHREAVDALARCHARMDRSIERVERLAKRRAAHGYVMVRHEIRQSAEELAEQAAAAEREREKERRASRREAALDEAATRENVAAMLGEGWTAGELAEVGITPALLARLGLDGPRQAER
jgi:hypothetical protein